jgi:dihydroorotate dehydrogenase electron transfer subunit
MSSYEIVHIEEIISHNPNLKTFVFDRPIGKPLPGQFMMMWIPGINEKPFSYSLSNEIIVEKRGPFTEELFKKAEGDFLHVRGPKGQGFPTDRSYDGIGVVGGSGLGPILYAAKKGWVSKILYGARTVDAFVRDERFEKMKVKYATDDGTKGHKGFVTDLLLENIKPDSKLFVCGPEQMMKKTFELLQDFYKKNPSESKDHNAYFSLERRMKCACGICGACSCSGSLVCSDGPVYSFDDLLDMSDFGSMRRTKSGAKVKLAESD